MFMCIIPNIISGKTIEHVFNLSSTENIEYSTNEVQIHNGRIKLNQTFSWTNTGTLTNDAMPCYLFCDSKGNLFYSAAHQGSDPYAVYRSSDYGITWTQFHTYIINSMIEDISGALYYAASDNNSRSLEKSTDNGLTWSNLFSPDRHTRTIYQTSSTKLYLSVHNYNTGPNWSRNILYISMDYGTNWTAIYTNHHGGITSDSCFAWFYELDNHDLIASEKNPVTTSGRICISSNKGTNWTTLVTNVRYHQGIIKTSDNNLYAFGDDGIIKSENGWTWNSVSSESCLGLIESSDNIMYKTFQSNVWKSYDKGVSWEKTPDLLKGTTNHGIYLDKALIQANNGLIYVGAGKTDYNGYVFQSHYPDSSEVILNLTPEKVKRWDSFSLNINQNNGSIDTQFSTSRNNGITWTEWQELNENNLKNSPCQGEGLDQIRIRTSLLSLNKISSPEINSISIKYLDSLENSNNDNIIIAPNPYKPYVDQIDHITFFNVGNHFNLYIYSITGKELIHIQSNSENGQYQWDVRDKQGNELNTGTYICYIKNDLNVEQRIKFSVLR